MSKTTKNEEEILEETSKEAEKITEKPKTIPPIQQARPAFLNSNSFGKGKPLNNFNNRQRPGRAASRGR